MHSDSDRQQRNRRTTEISGSRNEEGGALECVCLADVGQWVRRSASVGMYGMIPSVSRQSLYVLALLLCQHWTTSKHRKNWFCLEF